MNIVALGCSMPMTRIPRAVHIPFASFSNEENEQCPSSKSCCLVPFAYLSRAMLRTLAILLLASALTACSLYIETGGEGQPCQDTGSCDIGLVCVSGICERDPCLGLTCGENAICEAGVCVCLPGYDGNPNVRCDPTDPCLGVTCGENAICEAGVCVCLPGYDGNPNVRCDPTDSCLGVTCGENAICEAGVCVCLPGYDGNPDILCEEVDPCADQCGDPCPPCSPNFADVEIGVRYHSLVGGPHAFGATFLNNYHLFENRATAVGQMQRMVDDGITLIHLTIWPAGGPPHSWGSAFPLSPQELTNLSDFVSDVRDLRSATTDLAPRLHLSLLDGGDSQFKTVEENDVFPVAGGTARNGHAFLDVWRQTIDGIIQMVESIRYEDDTPVLQKIYLGGELMLRANGSSPYDGDAGWVLQWFLTNMFPYFWDACVAAGIEPSTYFFAWPIVEWRIFDGSWLDIVESSLTWWNANLPNHLPARLDISVYTGDHSIPDYTANQRERILATTSALDQLVTRVYGPAGRDYAFVEAHYYHVEADHPGVRAEAFAAYRDIMEPTHANHHPRFRGMHFWPYPYSILGGPNVNGAAPPFELEAFAP